MSTRCVVTIGGGETVHQPPVERSQAVRVLVVTAPDLGWRTQADALRRLTDERDDLDAVHVHVPTSRLVRLAGAKVGGYRPPGILDPHHRRQRVQSAELRRWLDRHIDLTRFDVVHVSPHLLAGPIVDALAGPALTVTVDSTVVQGKISRQNLDEETAIKRMSALRDLERAAIDRAAGVACFSRWAADAVAAEYGRTQGVFVELPALPPSGHRRQGPASDPVRILFVGNDFVRKGGDRLVAWHHALFADRAELHIASAQAPDDGRPNVVVHGAVPHDRLLGELLPSMDLFVLPTRADQSPWALPEALGAGLPVITSRIGGVPELVPDGAGVLVDPEDDDGFVRALLDFVDDEAFRERMLDAAEAYSPEQHWATNTGRLVDAWHEACS